VDAAEIEMRPPVKLHLAMLGSLPNRKAWQNALREAQIPNPRLPDGPPLPRFGGLAPFASF